MITATKKRFPKKLIIASSVVILLVAGALTYVYSLNGSLFGWKVSKNTTSDNNKINYGPATSEQQKSGTQTKSDSVNNNSDPAKPTTNSSDTPPAPTPVPDSSKKSVLVAITAANQSGANFQIRTQINTVSDTGTCMLTLTKTGQPTVTKTAGVQAYASISTCKGFDVAVSELSLGTWQASISYDSSDLTGHISTSITIK